MINAKYCFGISTILIEQVNQMDVEDESDITLSNVSDDEAVDVMNDASDGESVPTQEISQVRSLILFYHLEN